MDMKVVDMKVVDMKVVDMKVVDMEVVDMKVVEVVDMKVVTLAIFASKLREQPLFFYFFLLFSTSLCFVLLRREPHLALPSFKMRMCI